MIPLRDDQSTFSTPFVNYFLIVLNVVVFVWELSVSHRALNSVMFEFGVVPHHTLAVLGGQSPDGLATAVLPLFTSLFLHASFLHVAGNMLFLWIFGDNVEDFYGHITYLFFYLVCGIGAGLLHVLFNWNSTLPSLGASGAISGVMGAYLILYPRSRILTLVFIFLVPIPAVFILALWFVMQFVSGVSSLGMAATGGVAWWAHVGGFLLGMGITSVTRRSG